MATAAWYSVSNFLDPQGKLKTRRPLTVLQQGTNVMADLRNIDGSTATNPLPANTPVASGIAGGIDPNGNVQFGVMAPGIYDLFDGSTFIGTAELPPWAVAPGVTLLGPSSGTDDTSWINATLASAPAQSYVRGTVGQTYLVSSPLVLRQGGVMTLDMTRCTIKYANTSVRTNFLNNGSVQPSATATDITTTAGSNVITSPTLVAAGASVGMQVGVVGAGCVGGGSSSVRIWLYGNITAIAGNNITLGGNYNPTQADIGLTNATGYLYRSRDADVTIIGGTWDGGTNWNVNADRYNAAYNSNFLRFRRLDGLKVRDVKLAIDYGYYSSGMGWCFGIAPADCSDILIDSPSSAPGQAASTLINSSGMIQRCIVRNAIGTTYDDMVAFGTVGAGGDDIEGDIGDLEIDGVFASYGGPAAYAGKGSNRGVDLYGGYGSNGQQRVFWNAAIKTVKGPYNNWPVSLVAYPGAPSQLNIQADLSDITGFKIGGGPQVFVGRYDGTAAGLNTGGGVVTGTINGPQRGIDLGYARITANTAAIGPAVTDIPGMSVLYTVGPNGIVYLEAYGYSVQQGTAAGNLLVYLTDGSNNVLQQAYLGNIAASAASPSWSLRTRVTGLASGSQWTAKLRVSSAGAGAVTVLAGAGFPTILKVSAG